MQEAEKLSLEEIRRFVEACEAIQFAGEKRELIAVGKVGLESRSAERAPRLRAVNPDAKLQSESNGAA